jgi:hypothetical protein
MNVQNNVNNEMSLMQMQMQMPFMTKNTLTTLVHASEEN